MADSTLWTLNDDSNDITNEVYRELAKYAKFCCESMHGKSESDCSTQQMAYWAFIGKKLKPDHRLEFLKGFDPSKMDEDIRQKACNCIKYEYNPNKCYPVVHYNTSAFNSTKKPIFFHFPFFAFGEGKSNTHSEQVLLPKISYAANEMKARDNTSDFYMYSYNSPCSRDLDRYGSCLKNIFVYSDRDMYKGTKPWHTMNVGFYKWYVFENSIDNSRDLFCDKMDKEQAEYNTRDFSTTLKFRKFHKYPGTKTIKSDQKYYKDLKNGEC